MRPRDETVTHPERGEREATGRHQPYASVRETHSAVLFFLGDLALKAKKPVDLGFLDFSTRPKRLQACRREVALNRELSPDVYLGVWDVTDEFGRPRDHLVVMRRMPDDRRLATLVRAGRDVSDEIAQIAHVVAAFHGRCARSELIAQGGSRRALADRWEATFAQVVPFTGPVLDPDVVGRVELLTRRYLAGRDALFEDRRRRDAVLAGHGDLMAEDIFCLPDGPRILDCIDFDDALRHLDRLDDAAFLVMDLERLGSPTAATLFRERYLELSGDAAPESLFEHYIAYRAFMRAKVACLRNAQGDPSSADEARRLSALALHHLTQARVRLVLVGGPPGTGKTTLATALADRLGMVVLSSDRVRKELAGVPTEASLRAPYLDGAYSSESTSRTYRELMSRAERLLAMGESVILDATWADAGRRGAARAVAERTASELVQLECRTAPALVARRLATRTSMSDADEVVAARLRTSFADWPEAVDIDTTHDPQACLAEAVRHVEGEVPASPRRPRLAPD